MGRDCGAGKPPGSRDRPRGACGFDEPATGQIAFGYVTPPILGSLFANLRCSPVSGTGADHVIWQRHSCAGK